MCITPFSSHTLLLAVSGFSHLGRAYAASISRNSPSLSHTLAATPGMRLQHVERCDYMLLCP